MRPLTPENIKRKNLKLLQSSYSTKVSVDRRPPTVSIDNIRRKEREELKKAFSGDYKPSSTTSSYYPNRIGVNSKAVYSNSSYTIGQLKRHSQIINQPIIEKIKFNLGKCKDVTKKYNKLNDEFNYTIKIVTNMVTLIETNGKFLQQIQEILNDDMLSDTEITKMRQNHENLVIEFKRVYTNLIEKNKEFIDPETFKKLEENIINFEAVSRRPNSFA